MSRQQLSIPGGKAFVIKDFLTLQESEDLLHEAKERGFASIEWEYHKTYRDCTRVIIRDDELAKKIWKKLLPHLKVDDLDVKPFGYGAEGFWIPKGINPLFRITKYVPGGHFDVHRDGGFVVTDDLRSIYTFMLYLQAPSKGGETHFYASTKTNDLIRPSATVTPEGGDAVVFTHDCAHEGAVVKDGEKYVLRTDLLFERTLRLEDGHFSSDPLYQEAERLYQESIRLQEEGEARQSTEAYVLATEIHARLSSVTTPATSIGNGPFAFIHADVMDHLLPWLSVADIASLMRTCRALMYKCRSPAHWHMRYKEDFTQGLVRFETGDEILAHDWFVLYGSRLLVEKHLPIVCVDVGSRYTKFATTQLKCDRLIGERWEKQWGYEMGPDPVAPGDFLGKINSVFSRNLGHYWSAGSGYCDVMARVTDADYHHWEKGTRGYKTEGYQFFPYSYPKDYDDEDGKPEVELNIGVWLEIIAFIEAYCLEHGSAQSPVILAVPPFIPKLEAKSFILEIMPQVSSGFLAVIASPILVTARHRLRNAAVISVGARFAWVSVVKNLELKDLNRQQPFWQRPLRACCKELPLGAEETVPNNDVLDSLAKWCTDIRSANVGLPLIITGGYASLYRAALCERLNIRLNDLLMSDAPDMDVAVGGVHFAALPEIKPILLKTPVVQKSFSWWSKKMKLNWETTEAALRRYHLPSLVNSQRAMWDVLENL